MTRRLLALVACSALLAACGDDDGGVPSAGGGGDGGEATTLKVGVIPIADVAPLYLGIEQGFFKDEGLDVEPQVAEGGAAIATSVLSGDYDFGFSNVVSLVIARSKDLPLKIVSQGVSGHKTEQEAFDTLLVPKGSDIREATDLDGKTVAVNALNNIGPLSINYAVEQAGGDYSQIKYVEVPFPDMIAALEGGRVDAAWVVEPFASQGKAAGMRSIFAPFEAVSPDLTIATYFTTEQVIEQKADVVDRFVRAMQKSLSFAQENPDAARKIVLTYTKIPEAAAQKMTLPNWNPDYNDASIEKTIELAQKYGFIEKPVPLDELIRRGG
jgi:NitT/TauT family transport system substrate-binding protein